MSHSRSRRTGPWLALLIALSAGCGWDPGNAPPRVRLGFEKLTLGNGLRVIMRRDPRLARVALQLDFATGTRDEGQGRTGFALLGRRMLIDPPGGARAPLENDGVTLVRAESGFDRTTFAMEVPSNELEWALWHASERMGLLNAGFDATSLASLERALASDRHAAEDEPYRASEEEMFSRLFPRGHPYHTPGPGSPLDVESAGVTDVLDFLKRHYGPERASLALVGDIDLVQARGLVRRYFEGIPRGPAAAATDVAAAANEGRGRAVVSDAIPLPRVSMAWATPPAFSRGDATADVTARILGQGPLSRLHRALVDDAKLARGVEAHQRSFELCSVLDITATARPGREADELEAAIDRELARLASSGPTRDELAAAKTTALTEMVLGLERMGGAGGVADRLCSYGRRLRDPGRFEWDLARYGSVSAGDVRRFVAERLARGRGVVVHARPGAKQPGLELSAGPEPEKAKGLAGPGRAEPLAPSSVGARAAAQGPTPAPGPPPPSPPSIAPLPSATRLVLNNGLTVLLIESHELPVVEARLVVRAGAAADPPEKPGLAGLTLALLDEGAGKHDARGIRRELEAAGARLDVATLADGSSLAISTLRPQAAHALEILADLVTAPAFRPADLERIRHERLNAVRQEGLSAVRAAVHAMSSSLFGDAHPYGHVAVGTENGLQSIENADVVAFHGRRYVPRNAALVLAGDLTRDDALLLAGRAFAAWRDPWAESEAQGGTALAAPEVAAPEMAAPGSGRVAIVDLPGAPRAVLFAGEAGVARSHPDFEPLMLAHRVLGDRLARALGREPNSGMFSFLPETRGQGPLVVGAIVANEGAYAAAKAALEQAAGMRERAVTGAELDAARRAALAAMTGRFETLGLAAMAYGEAWLAGLPPDSCAGYPARLMRLTAAQVSDAARRRLSPERVKVVAAGDGKAIEPGLRRLGLGAIARRRPEGAMPLAAQ